MTNIAEILKDCPAGTKLYSPLFGEVELNSVRQNYRVDDVTTICIDTSDTRQIRKCFDAFGRYFALDDSECLLFPSKEIRTWEDWEVPVEHKFKVGDWIHQHRVGIYKIIEVCESWYEVVDEFGHHYSISFKEEKNCELWTIEDAKDGDVLVTDGFIFIFKDIDNGNGVHYYCAYELSKHKDDEQFHVAECNSLMGRVGNSYTHYSLATSKQRKLLFDAMNSAGYQWYAGAKELKKIQPHYDISNFNPFDKVLVRDGDKAPWRADFFEEYDDNFYCFRGAWEQCIPFNEETKHLLGATDMPDECYINW